MEVPLCNPRIPLLVNSVIVLTVLVRSHETYFWIWPAEGLLDILPAEGGMDILPAESRLQYRSMPGRTFYRTVYPCTNTPCTEKLNNFSYIWELKLMNYTMKRYSKLSYYEFLQNFIWYIWLDNDKILSPISNMEAPISTHEFYCQLHVSLF